MITKEQYKKNAELLKLRGFEASKNAIRSSYSKKFTLDVRGYEIAEEMRYLSSEYMFKIQRAIFFNLELVIYINASSIET